MKLSKYSPRARGARSSPALGLLLASIIALALASSAGAAATPVPLAMADSFGVLAGTGITNTGATMVNGDIGTSPITTTSGTAITVNGTDRGGGAITQQAKNDLGTAYDNAAGQAPASAIVADLGGQVLTPGAYNSASSIALTGILTLDALDDPSAVFVFQAGSTLITAAASQVNLINGARSCNVFWQVGSSATLGADSTLRGTILALASITAGSGVTVDGRLLARDGTVSQARPRELRPVAHTCSSTIRLDRRRRRATGSRSSISTAPGAGTAPPTHSSRPSRKARE